MGADMTRSISTSCVLQSVYCLLRKTCPRGLMVTPRQSYLPGEGEGRERFERTNKNKDHEGLTSVRKLVSSLFSRSSHQSREDLDGKTEHGHGLSFADDACPCYFFFLLSTQRGLSWFWRHASCREFGLFGFWMDGMIGERLYFMFSPTVLVFRSFSSSYLSLHDFRFLVLIESKLIQRHGTSKYSVH